MQLNRRTLVVAIAAIGVIYWFGFRAEPSWKVRNHPPRGTKTAALGDSLTYGAGTSKAEFNYPQQLGALLGVSIQNYGRNGDTTEGALNRLDDVIKTKPDIVIVLLGGNDLIQRTPIDQTLSNLRQIFQRLTAEGIMVVYGGLSPPLVGDNWYMAIQQLCKEEGILSAGDVMKGLWGDSTKMSDQIHPNDAGYAILARRFHEVIKKFY